MGGLPATQKAPEYYTSYSDARATQAVHAADEKPQRTAKSADLGASPLWRRLKSTWWRDGSRRPSAGTGTMPNPWRHYDEDLRTWPRWPWHRGAPRASRPCAGMAGSPRARGRRPEHVGCLLLSPLGGRMGVAVQFRTRGVRHGLQRIPVPGMRPNRKALHVHQVLRSVSNGLQRSPYGRRPVLLCRLPGGMRFQDPGAGLRAMTPIHPEGDMTILTVSWPGARPGVRK